MNERTEITIAISHELYDEKNVEIQNATIGKTDIVDLVRTKLEEVFGEKGVAITRIDGNGYLVVSDE